MQSVKDLAALLGAIIGALSGIVTLYAKYRDLKSKSARTAETEPDVEAVQPNRLTPTGRGTASVRVRPLMMDGPDVPRLSIDEPPIVLRVDDAPRRPSTAHARELVRAPAIALMVAGGLSLIFNLTTVAYGYVDQFVTPLTAESAAQHASAPPGDEASTVIGLIAILGFSVASAAALWAGYNMLRLRSYWLSMAGSVAIMPGAFLCCFAGLPIGLWSLVILMKPEVKGVFS